MRARIYADAAAANAQRRAIDAALGYPVRCEEVGVRPGRFAKAPDGGAFLVLSPVGNDPGRSVFAHGGGFAIVVDESVEVLHGRTIGGVTIDVAGALPIGAELPTP
jgi:hypothetical protein